MATYTPAGIIPITSLSASGGTSLLTGVNATLYIFRSIHVQSAAAGKTFTLSFGADAAGKRLWDAYALTQNVPFDYNGWLEVTGSGAAHDVDGNCSATTVTLIGSGLTWA